MAFEELVASRKSAMTVAQVAEILSVSQRLIYQLVAAGEVPHFRVGAAVRFEPKTLSAWLNEKLQASSKSLRSRADGRNPQTGATVAHQLDDVWRAVLFPRPPPKKIGLISLRAEGGIIASSSARCKTSPARGLEFCHVGILTSPTQRIVI